MREVQKIRYRLPAIFATVISLMMTTSCDVHEFPEPQAAADVVLRLHYNEVMPIYQEINYPSGESIKTRAQISGYDVRYVVEFYKRIGNGYAQQPEKRVVVTDTPTEILDRDIEVNLPKGTYRVIAWTDYVDAGTQTDKFFDTTSLENEVAVCYGNNDYVDNNMRDAFRSVAEVSVDSGRKVVDMEMTRPMARFEFIADDFEALVTRHRSPALDGFSGKQAIEKALALGLYKVQFYYVGFMPSAYNLVKNFNADSVTGAMFMNEIRPILSRDDAVVLGYDYVFINPTGGAVDMRLVIYDDNGKMVGSSSKITVPLKQGYKTVIRGKFVSGDSDSSGGLGLSPDFIGPDYNIRI